MRGALSVGYVWSDKKKLQKSYGEHEKMVEQVEESKMKFVEVWVEEGKIH